MSEAAVAAGALATVVVAAAVEAAVPEPAAAAFVEVALDSSQYHKKLRQ